MSTSKLVKLETLDRVKQAFVNKYPATKFNYMSQDWFRVKPGSTMTESISISIITISEEQMKDLVGATLVYYDDSVVIPSILNTNQGPEI